jgi:hypothetical protein
MHYCIFLKYIDMYFCVLMYASMYFYIEKYTYAYLKKYTNVHLFTQQYSTFLVLYINGCSNLYYGTLYCTFVYYYFATAMYIGIPIYTVVYNSISTFVWQ